MQCDKVTINQTHPKFILTGASHSRNISLKSSQNSIKKTNKLIYF